MHRREIQRSELAQPLDVIQTTAVWFPGTRASIRATERGMSTSWPEKIVDVKFSF